MDRPASSTSSDSASSDIFSYQKQLLERKSSLSRSSSRTSSIFPPNTATPRTAAPTHKWAPGHRNSASIDAVRSKWEERARESSPERAASDQPSPAMHSTPSATWAPADSILTPKPAPLTTSMTMQRALRDLNERGLESPRRTTFPSDLTPRQQLPLAPVTNLTSTEMQPPSSPTKRLDSIRSKWERSSSPERVSKDLPPLPSRSSILSSNTPLSPVGTGSSSSTLARTDSTSSTSSSHRMNSIRSKWEQRERDLQAVEKTVADQAPPTPRRSTVSSVPAPFASEPPVSASPRLSTSLASQQERALAPLSATDASLEGIRTKYGLRTRDPSSERKTQSTPTALKRYTMPVAPTKSFPDLSTPTTPTSFATPAPQPFHLSTSTDFQSSSLSAVKRLGSFAVPSPDRTTFEPSPRIGALKEERHFGNDYSPPPLSPSASSAMYPAPYVSSGRTIGKKYGSSLTDGRRLGRHLPRIASGDGADHAEAKPTRPYESRRSRRQEPSEELMIPGITNATDVVGVPGRLKLSRAKGKAPTPLPSSRLTTGLWADVQRNLLQAYEYLCHVGEAQQWVEGCLGSELGFGVVEMEEGLRSGVVLAKLVRAFEGEGAIKRIYEAPKLDYLQTDNINHFLAFVRRAGLPECFIFETLDLYEKKNFPKVIFCIHALSHLLAKRGLAERIGSLLGQLKFSDEQLQQTQRGLDHAGVPLPNFGAVGQELAMEMNEEPDVEVETDDERRDRLLLENEKSIVELQAQLRAYVVRREHSTLKAQLRFAEPTVARFQAHCIAALTRRRAAATRRQRGHLAQWAVALQACARGLLVRRYWIARLRVLARQARYITMMQAQIRGVIQRRRYARLKAALKSVKFTVTRLQTISRAKLAKRSHQELKKRLERPVVMRGIVNLQAAARGVIVRRREQQRQVTLRRLGSSITSLQAHARGVLVRRRIKAQLAKLTDISDVIVKIQCAVRSYLAGKRLLALIRGLRRANSSIVPLQARARAVLARRKHQALIKSLARTSVIKSVSTLQSLARAAIVRNQRREQTKRFEFCSPDVVGLQATCRSYLVRVKYIAWRNHIYNNIPTIVLLQSLFRGTAQRLKFRAKMEYYRANLDKVVKIQSLVRAKDTREQYRRLTLGKNVNVSTIKNFVHLLDDSEADFKEEIEIEKLRERLVKSIRENQALETDVSELDVKIGLVVQNSKSLEELIKARRRYGADGAVHASRASVLAAHGDPFASPATLDHATKRKLELYQQLFFLLQTRSDYLARLLFTMTRSELPDKNRRMLERLLLSLFGFGQNRREDYLLMKFFQHAIYEEVNACPDPEVFSKSYPLYMNIAVQYIRPKQLAYVRDSFQAIIREVVEQEDLDLETDPVVLHRTRVNVEEMKSGRLSNIPKDVSFKEAIEDFYPETRGEYIRNLQKLLAICKAFVQAILASTKKLPYGIRYIAHETLVALRARFPQHPPEILAASMGRLIYYRFINTAIVAPETFDIVQSTIGPLQRKNLAAVSRVLTQIASGVPFDTSDISMVPVNDYVIQAITQMTNWFLEVADVPQAEIQMDAHEFLDVAVQPKPIFISPNEIYSMHRFLITHLSALAPRREDPLRVILHDLDGVPNLGSDELNDARDRAVTLELTNRFAEVEDPHAAEKALWVQAKRSVLAILRVQPAKDLIESLMQPVAEEHESLWEEIVEHDLMAEDLRYHERRQPSTGGEAAYRLEDIQSLSFREVKAHAISCLLKLEKQGKLSREDGYQGILNAIAGDVRSKHRKRLERQREMESMKEAMAHLAERKRFYMEQINSYNNYVEAALQTMQRGKGKKRFVMPFTKQFFHLRDLQKTGQSPQFGSFKYSALDLYHKGILLFIDQYSPKQFDRIDVVLSSDMVGVFSMELLTTSLGSPLSMASTDIRLNDLLQAQFENRTSISLFNGMAKFNVNLLLYQINKKFYV